MTREVLRDALVYLPAKAVPAIAGLVAIPILTRLLEPQLYGEYLLAMTSLTLIAGVTVTWLVTVTIRFYIVHGVSSLARSSWVLLLAALLLAGATWVTVALVLGPPFGNSGYLAAGLAWITTYGLFEYFAGWLRARNFAASFSVALSWRSLAGLGITVILLTWFHRGGEAVLAGGALAMILALMILPGRALNVDASETEALDTQKPKLSLLLSYGIPAGISNLITVGLSLSDRYVVESFLGIEYVAIYAANYDLAEKSIFFLNSMLLLSSSVIGFRVFEQEGEKKATEFLAGLMRIYLVSAPLLVVAMSVLASPIVRWLLPRTYDEGAIVLPLVVLGGFFVGVMHRYSLLLSFHRRTDLIMLCGAGAWVANLVLCFVLVPRAGLLGAAISTAAGYGLWLILIRAAAGKYLLPRFPYRTLLNVLPASLVCAGAMYYLAYDVFGGSGAGIPVSFVAGSTTYLAVLLILRELSVTDLSTAISELFSRFCGSRRV